MKLSVETTDSEFELKFTRMHDLRCYFSKFSGEGPPNERGGTPPSHTLPLAQAFGLHTHLQLTITLLNIPGGKTAYSM